MVKSIDERQCKRGLGKICDESDKLFDVGDWVKVLSNKGTVGFSEFVGKVVYTNCYFFVVKSGVGKFCESYLWVDAFVQPQLFKKITEEEAYCFINRRLKSKMW